MTTFNFDVLENANKYYKTVAQDIEQFNSDFLIASRQLNYDFSILNKYQTQFIQNSDDIMSDNTFDKSEIENAINDMKKVISTMDIEKYDTIKVALEKVKANLSKQWNYEEFNFFGWGATTDNSDANESNFGVSITDPLKRVGDTVFAIQHRQRYTMFTRMILDVLQQEFDNFMGIYNNYFDYPQMAFNLRLANFLLWEVKIGLSEKIALLKLDENVKFNRYNRVVFFNPPTSNNQSLFYDDYDKPIKSKFETSATDLKLKDDTQKDIMLQQNDIIGNMSESFESYAKTIKSKLDAVTAGGEKNDVIFDIKRYAVESKYFMYVESPIKTNDKRNQKLFDNTHFVSSSIPSMTVDVLESRINNLRRKSAGNIIVDTFSITFRDTPSHDYYNFFRSWMFSIYADDELEMKNKWDSKIRLYKYPSDYMGKIGFLLLRSDGRQFGEDEYDNLSNTPVISDGGLVEGNKESNEGVYEHDWIITTPIENSNFETFNYNIDIIKDKFKEGYSNYISDKIIFNNVFITQIGDIRLDSTSSEYRTFDVTFDFTYPVEFYRDGVSTPTFIV